MTTTGWGALLCHGIGVKDDTRRGHDGDMSALAGGAAVAASATGGVFCDEGTAHDTLPMSWLENATFEKSPFRPPRRPPAPFGAGGSVGG